MVVGKDAGSCVGGGCSPLRTIKIGTDLLTTLDNSIDQY